VPRLARDAGARLALDHDGAGVRQGLSGRHHAARPLLRIVLAHAGHHLGRDFHRCLFDGDGRMSDMERGLHLHSSDVAPGDERADGREIAEGILGYLIGFGVATLLTVVAFFISGTSLVWQPSIPIALIVLAIAQMGVHLVFFLHITSGPESYNNMLALMF